MAVKHYHAHWLSTAAIGDISASSTATSTIGATTTNPSGFVTAYSVPFNTTTLTKTVLVTVAAGDVLVILAETLTSGNTLSTPTGGGLTYTLQQSIVAVASENNVYLWTAVSASSQTFTLSITMAGVANNWGYTALRFSGIASVGVSNKGTGSGTAPSISLTTTGSQSIIVAGDSDFNASATAATYLTSAGTATEDLHDTSAGGGTFWCWHHANAGVTGAKTLGMSAPTQNWAIVAVELRPSSTGPVGDVSSPSTSASIITAARSDTGIITSSITSVAPTFAVIATNPGAITISITTTGTGTATRSDIAGLSSATTSAASVSAIVVGPGTTTGSTTSAASIAGGLVATTSVARTSTALVAATAVGPGLLTPSVASSASVVGARVQTGAVTTSVTSAASVTATVVGPATTTASVTSVSSVSGTRSDTAGLTGVQASAASVAATTVGPGVVTASRTNAASVIGSRSDSATSSTSFTATSTVSAVRTDTAGLIGSTTAAPIVTGAPAGVGTMIVAISVGFASAASRTDIASLTGSIAAVPIVIALVVGPGVVTHNSVPHLDSAGSRTDIASIAKSTTASLTLVGVRSDNAGLTISAAMVTDLLAISPQGDVVASVTSAAVLTATEFMYVAASAASVVTAVIESSYDHYRPWPPKVGAVVLTDTAQSDITLVTARKRRRG